LLFEATWAGCGWSGSNGEGCQLLQLLQQHQAYAAVQACAGTTLAAPQDKHANCP
jgi:hypothetical protein